MSKGAPPVRLLQRAYQDLARDVFGRAEAPIGQIAEKLNEVLELRRRCGKWGAGNLGQAIEQLQQIILARQAKGTR